MSNINYQKNELKNILFNLSQPGVLENYFQSVDSVKPFNRIYIMGCGRSGTWLLTTLFYCFSDTAVVPKELPVEYFGLLKSNASNLVLKRNDKAYERVEEIPESISIIWIVRHPFDVLTSFNEMSGRKYHIQPWRFIGEMQALKYMIDTGRLNTLIVKYEDLVKNPIDILNQIASQFKLSIKFNPNDIWHQLQLPTEAVRAMNGVREVNTDSINRFKKDQDNIPYLKRIYPRIEPMLSWVENKFGYNTDYFN